MVLGYLLMNYRISLDEDVDDILKHRAASFGNISCDPKISVRVTRL